MVIDSSLSQKATQFSNNMDIRKGNADKTPEQQTHEMKAPKHNGDTISISQEARALSAPEKSEIALKGKKKSKKSKDEESLVIKSLKEQIKKLEQEIKELEKSNLPQKEKTKQILEKQSQLMQFRDQLAKAQEKELKAKGHSASGGTAAQGFGNSVSNF